MNMTNKREREILAAKCDLVNAKNNAARAVRIGSDLMARLAEIEQRNALTTLKGLILPLIDDLATELAHIDKCASQLNVDDTVDLGSIDMYADQEDAVLTEMYDKRLRRVLPIPIIQLVLA